MSLESSMVYVFMQLYRNEHSMHQAIQSVLDQTYKNLRFCILTSSATKDAVLEYAAADIRIEVVDGVEGESNASYYERQKELLRKSGGAYFTRLDADDWYDVHYLETLVRFAETYHTDITACGNYFVDGTGKTVGDRRQQNMIWETEDTAKVLPYMYGLYRTIWGKLIAADAFLNQRIHSLPEADEYGSYGGDTIYMFNLLSGVKRLGICDQLLYYYRLSPAGHSYMLRENRLESDAYLFRYVEHILKRLGGFGEPQRRFLCLIYGNAVKDTTALLVRQDLSAAEKSGKLLYIHEHELTRELLERERGGRLAFAKGQDKTHFISDYYEMIFGNAEFHALAGAALEHYLKLFELLYVKWRGLLSLDEFAVFIARKSLLDALVREQYETLFSALLEALPAFTGEQAEICLQLLRRLSGSAVLQPALQERTFVIRYADLLRDIHRMEDEAAFARLRRLFSRRKAPRCAVQLAQLWSNLAAQKENADEFIVSKECLTEALLLENRVAEAWTEYALLQELGVDSAQMRAFAARLQQE